MIETIEGREHSLRAMNEIIPFNKHGMTIFDEKPEILFQQAFEH